ncbi:MAG: hypothetical protein E7006_04490 [Alphaproteobacteria bacterium]|nr:hypothetical protein [Alphaproteobacteria bacterium]
MKKSLLLSLFGVVFMGTAMAADITLYYSPHCPHCHHAREFIAETLVYEYPELKVTAVNVTDQANRPDFQAALSKCGFNSGGVPVLVIGDKCEQGYADFMQDDLRALVEADMTDAQKEAATANKKALSEDATKFKSEHADRANAITEYIATPSDKTADAAVQKKNNNGGIVWFWGVLIALVAGLGFVLVRKDKK